jgi:hypothetical protein
VKLFDESSFDLAIVDIFLKGSNGSDLIAELCGRAAPASRCDFRNDRAGLSIRAFRRRLSAEAVSPAGSMRAIEAAQGSRPPPAGSVTALAG